jgi:hypothetical protein
MILTGSNNCYEVGYRGREKRERNWYSLSYYTRSHNEFYAPADVILQKIEDEKNEKLKELEDAESFVSKQGYTSDGILENYGSHLSIKLTSARSTYKNYYNFFKNGIKNAKTIEELNAVGINLRFSLYFGSKEAPETIKQPETVNIHSELQFYTQYKELLQYKYECSKLDKNCEPSIFLTFSGHYENVEYNMKKLALQKLPREKKLIEVEQYFVLENQSGYLVRYTRFGFKYVPWHSSYQVKKFLDFKKATNYRLKLIKEKKHMAGDWKVTTINEKVSFYI